jgi:PAS domain S-box-containing protein
MDEKIDLDLLKTAVATVNVPEREKKFLLKVLDAVSGGFTAPDASAESFDQKRPDETTSFSVEEKLALTFSKLDIIMENAVVGIMFIKDRKFVRVNKRAEKMFGMENSKVYGTTVEPWYSSHEEYLRMGAGCYPVISSGGEYSGEHLMRRADGTFWWCKISGKAIDPADLSKGFLFILDDIDQRKKAEEALILAKKEAEDATKLKDKFVSLVSHDLRSPLSSITNMLDYLQSNKEKFVEEKRDEMTKKVIKSANALLGLIDQLLDISRLQSGSITLVKRTVRIKQSIDEVVFRTSHLAERKGILIENSVPQDHRLVVDPTLYNEVIHNLVSNAVKFTERGGKITIFAHPDKPNTIIVSDTGVGINPRIIGDIFKSEIKTSTLGTAGELGSGFGLPYCREIIALHGGKIEVESELGKGTSFHIIIRSFDALILLVDDQEAHRKMMREIIKGSISSEFIEAENGTAALEHLKLSRPHLIITDLNMPSMDGYSLIEHIRKRPEFDSTPLLAATSGETSQTSNEQAHHAALVGGADGFTLKPVIASEFILLVKSLLELRKSPTVK